MVQAVLFVADDGNSGLELWRRLPDGTTELVADIAPARAPRSQAA